MAKQPVKKSVKHEKKETAPQKAWVLSNLLPEPLAKKIFFVFAGLLLVLMVTISHQYGISGDENFHRTYGHHIVDFYRTMGKDTTSATVNGPDSLMVVYGGFYDGTATLISKAVPSVNEWDVRHFVNSIFGFLAMLFAALVATEVAGWQAGLITLVLMAFSPRFFGESMNNPKDITMATGYMLSYLFIIKFLKQLPRPNWKITLGLGISIGVAMGIRVGGLLLIPYLWMFYGLAMVIEYGVAGVFDFSKFRKNLWPGLKFVILASVIGYFSSLIFWPYGLVSPFKHPLEALTTFSNYPVHIAILFDGTRIMSTDVPWYYEPQWLLISAPIIVLAGYFLSALILPYFLERFNVVKGKGVLYAAAVAPFALLLLCCKFNVAVPFQYLLVTFIIIGAAMYAKSRNMLYLIFIFFSIYFPIAFIISKKSALYDGMRHIYFIYPSLVILAGITIHYLVAAMQSKYARYIMVAVAVILVALPARFMFANHPNQYVYFNELEGGIKGAYGNYETDYYMNSVKQCADWLKSHETLKKKDGKKINIFTNAVAPCNFYFDDTANISVGYVSYRNRLTVNADYFVFYNRYVDRELILNNAFPPVPAGFTAYADGVPLSCAIKVDKSGHEGVAALMSGDFETAVKQLSGYCARYPKDDAALPYYAKACIPPLRYYGAVKEDIMSKIIEGYKQTLKADSAAQQNYKNGIAALNTCLALKDDHTGNPNEDNMDIYADLYIAYYLGDNMQQAQVYGNMVQQLQQQMQEKQAAEQQKAQ